MKLLSLNGVEVKCSPLLLIALPAALLFGRAGLLLVVLLSLFTHEAAHACVAARLGIRVYSVEMQPFGAVARMDLLSVPAGEAAAVWAAGPAASLCMAGMSALVEKHVPVYAAAGLGLTEFNLLIAGVNLLPALPLDGGRRVCALVGRRAKTLALPVTRALGVITGAAFLLIFAALLARGFINITFAVMGVFLIIAALREREPAVPADVTRLVLSGTPLDVAAVAVLKNESISRALRLLPRGAFAVVIAVDGRGRRVGEIDGSRLREAAVRLGADAELSEAVALYRSGLL